MTTFLAVLALITVIGSLVAFIRRDTKRNPARDWHVDADAAVYVYPPGTPTLEEWAASPKGQAFMARAEARHEAEETARFGGAS